MEEARTYFPNDFFAFFQELAANNHKAWFDENRKRYEKAIRDPFKALVADFLERIAAIDPDFPPLKPNKCMFRINRDIRFSKDKTPYKTHLAAYFSPRGRKAHYPGLYMQLSPEQVMIAGGVYELNKDSLTNLRQTLSERSNELHALLVEEAFRTTFNGELHGERNKVLPKQFKEAAQKEPLLYNKQLYFTTQLPPEIITTPNLLPTLEEHYRIALPVNRWIAEAIGEGTKAD